MCGTSLAGFPQSIGHADEGHDPLISIIFPVGISLTASLADHISCLRGNLFVAGLEHPCLLGCVMSRGECLFFASRKGGVSLTWRYLLRN